MCDPLLSRRPGPPSLNKCAAADLGYLPVVNRIHLPAPARGFRTHVTKTPTSCSLPPVLEHYAAVDILY